MTPLTNDPKQSLRQESKKSIPDNDERVAELNQIADRREYNGEPVAAMLFRQEAYFLSQEGKFGERKPIIL